MKLINKLKTRYINPEIIIENFSEDIITSSNIQETSTIKTNNEEKKNNRVLYLSSETEIKNILNEEIENFFPRSGGWESWCFDKLGRREVSAKYLPCHLRDNVWLSKLINKKLIEDHDVYIDEGIICEYILNSARFKELRHEYELEVVRWQINWMITGGENWILPEGFSDCSSLFGTDWDICFRGGVVETLTEIGMNEEVIQEGIEKYADMWRDKCINKAFNQEFEPIAIFKTQIENSSEEFKENWINYRKYKYYTKHKYYVDKYGTVEPVMQINGEELDKLENILNKQIEERKEQIKAWENMDNDARLIRD